MRRSNYTEQFMLRALELARQAYHHGEVPVGAVVTRGSDIIAENCNRMRRDNDPAAHAEMLALRASCLRTGQVHLDDCDLYVTLEPCPMCAGAIALHRIRRLYFAAYDSKSGGVEHGAQVFQHATCHHKPEVIGGIQAQASRELLQTFFAALRSTPSDAHHQ